MMDAAKTRAKDKINEVNSSLTKLVQCMGYQEE